MSVDILINYKNFPSLEIELDSSSIKDQYKTLVRKCSSQRPISRDPRRYTEEYFRTLCEQAKEKLGWAWVYESYPLLVTTLLHKDIENFLSKGFENIPEEHDDLLHELHYGLHALQSNHDRGNWIQVEWFNDQGFAIPDDFEFSTQLEFGDVKLQNPYVGHDPAFVYFQKDHTNIKQTCRFHDLARPGINVMIKDYSVKVDRHYREWFSTQAPDWVAEQGWDKILRYTGWPKVGRVKNLNVLEQIADSDQFEIESVVVV